MPCDNPKTCGTFSNRNDQKCPGCQRDICRATKRVRNHYRPHGPCQTPATRAYGQRKAA